MNARQAGRLVRKAVAAGVEWCGINVEAGRPMMGCDPENTAASAMLAKLIVACQTDKPAIDAALWNYVMRESLAEAAAGKRLIATLGGKHTTH